MPVFGFHSVYEPDFGPLFRDFYGGTQWRTVEVRPFAEALKAVERLERTIAR